MHTHTQHPLSAAFPPMLDAEYAALRDSIRDIGVQNPITVLDNMVLDGWHRYCACCDLDVDCPEVTLHPDADPHDYVVAQNRHRRHNTAAQLALSVTAVYQSRASGENQHTNRGRTEFTPSRSTAEMAELAGVTPRSIQQAKQVHADAAPEVVAAVKRGEIGLPKAVAISRLPADQQAQAVKRPLDKPSKPPKEYGADGAAADAGPSESELAADALAASADLAALQLLIDADDKLATALAEIKRLNAEVAQLKVSRNGYMAEAAEYKTITTKVQRENDRLRKPK